MRIFLYGPPGSGKSTLGKRLAEALALPFFDLDERITRAARRTIPQIFAAGGESEFRRHESAALQTICAEAPAVIALGGGALLAAENRQLAAQTGHILCLQATPGTLAARTTAQAGTRPLLADNPVARLNQLLQERRLHYDSFPLRATVTNAPPSQNLALLQTALGIYRVSGMGAPYYVHIGNGLLAQCGDILRQTIKPTHALVVGDTNTAPLYGAQVADSLRQAGFQATTLTLAAGESQKNLCAIEAIWQAARDAQIDRGGLLVAVGGGVVGDLTGFAAATWLRGVKWVVVPTSLLAMVDSSLGGKTGADLPQGKNLIGAFHPPCAVISDPETLRTLPPAEIRAGLAETIKHGVIADPTLFADCAALAGHSAAVCGDATFVARAMAVKIKTICEDPYEKGVRAALNLGHTIGHGLEIASQFAISHGDAVAIGMVAAGKIATALNLAAPNLTTQLTAVLQGVDLPTAIPPDLDRAQCLAALQLDKKRADGIVRFVLPLQIGKVKTGIQVPTDILNQALQP